MVSRTVLTRRSWLAAVALGALTPALGACSGGADRSAGSQAGGRTTRSAAVSTAPDGTQDVVVTVGDDYVFLPDAFTVSPGPVRLTLVSQAAQLTHNFVFSPGQGPRTITEQIPIVAPGDEATMEFTVTDPGEYGYECSFHAALGQVGVMTVAG
ncbi:hypothetical protein GCM10023162_29110 [Klenkia terrae]